MIQVHELLVAEVLDAMAAERGGDDDIRMDMARGAVHLALALDLIDITEYRRRCDALMEVRYGPKKEDA